MERKEIKKPEYDGNAYTNSKQIYLKDIAKKS